MDTPTLRIGIYTQTFLTLLLVNQTDNGNHLEAFICHNQFSKTFAGQVKKEGEQTQLKFQEKDMEALELMLKSQVLNKDMEDIFRTLFNTHNDQVLYRNSTYGRLMSTFSLI